MERPIVRIALALETPTGVACRSNEHCDNGVCHVGAQPFSLTWLNIPRSKPCGSKVPCEYEGTSSPEPVMKPGRTCITLRADGGGYVRAGSWGKIGRACGSASAASAARRRYSAGSTRASFADSISE